MVAATHLLKSKLTVPANVRLPVQQQLYALASVNSRHLLSASDESARRSILLSHGCYRGDMTDVKHSNAIRV